MLPAEEQAYLKNVIFNEPAQIDFAAACYGAFNGAVPPYSNKIFSGTSPSPHSMHLGVAGLASEIRIFLLMIRNPLLPSMAKDLASTSVLVKMKTPLRRLSISPKHNLYHTHFNSRALTMVLNAKYMRNLEGRRSHSYLSA